MKKILVCGGRDFDDWVLLESSLNAAREEGETIHIIEGGAIGADFLSRVYAKVYGFPFTEFLPDWDKNGKRAGFIRNQQMLDEGKPDLVIAFPGNAGTNDMVARAIAAKVPITFIRVA